MQFVNWKQHNSLKNGSNNQNKTEDKSPEQYLNKDKWRGTTPLLADKTHVYVLI